MSYNVHSSPMLKELNMPQITDKYNIQMYTFITITIFTNYFKSKIIAEYGPTCVIKNYIL